MTEYDETITGRDRITVSLPPGTRDLLRRAYVDTGRAPDVSSVVEEALRPYVASEAARQRTRERITELRGGRPLPPEALAWARRALGVEDSAEGAGAA